MKYDDSYMTISTSMRVSTSRTKSLSMDMLTRVLFCVWDSLVATKYWTGANTAMTVAPIKALIPRR